MNRKISELTWKKLFWLSWWICQNPDCDEKVVLEWKKSIYIIWEWAHIEWHSSDWPRGEICNPEDNTFENLILLCPSCHKKIDKCPENYPKELLKSWKDNTIKKFIWVHTIQDWWNSIVLSTKKQIKPSLLLNWREKQVENLLKTLELTWKKIEIRSNSLLESFMFLFSVLIENKKINALIANNQEEFNILIKNKDKTLLIPKKWFIPTDIWIAISKWHNVVLFSWKKSLYTIHFDNSIDLWVMNRFDRIRWLKDILWDNEIAEKVYNETKWYLFPILRNRALDFNENLVPEWLDKVNKRVLTTIFLISEWEENTDIELVKILSGNIDYNEFLRDLFELEKQDDSPIRKINNIWQLVSKSDLWVFVKNEINEKVLNELEFVSKIALSDLDPRLDLPAEDRWMANILTNERPEFSSRSKYWLSDSLALLSIIKDKNIQNTINNIVEEVLNSNKNISRLLNSIGSNMENLAEASPEIFLKFINKNIENLDWIFEQWHMMMWWSWRYTNLLWSLERVSWNWDYINDVIYILFELDKKFDKNIPDNHSNRPFWTLSEIFIWWQNNTILTIDERIKLLEKVSNKYEQRVFDLLINIFNKTISSQIAKPNYQDWDNYMKPITNQEFNTYLIKIIKLLIDLSKKDIENRILDLIRNFIKFSKDDFNKVIDFLMKYDFSKFHNQEILLQVQSEIEKKLHFFKIYKQLSILTYYPEAEKKLIKLHSYITPNDFIISNISIFNEDRKIIISKLNDYKWEKWKWKDDLEIANKERNIRIIEIDKEHWFDGIMEMVKKLDYNHLVVSSIIETNLNDIYNENIFNLLDSEESKLIYFSINFIRQLDFKKNKFIDEKIKNINKFTNNEKKSNFLLWLILNTRTLQLIRKQETEVKKLFWEWLWKLNNYFNLNEEDYWEMDYFIWELNNYWLSYIAFNEIWMIEHKKWMDLLDNKLIIETLEKLPYFINNKIWNIHSLEYNLKNILDYLYTELEKWNIKKEELLKIEFIYVRVIDNPKIINNELINSPELYVQIICDLYKQRKSQKEEIWEDKKNKAENSYQILRKFDLIPWYKDWKINYLELENWISKVFELLKEKDRYDIWCQKIWELLINCPNWKDWIWPCEEIRNIFEKFKNDEIEKWFLIWKRNSRGVTSRWIYDWWSQERELAQRFLDDAEKLKIEYSRTSKILRQLWDSYMGDAKREDDQVELDR